MNVFASLHAFQRFVETISDLPNKEIFVLLIFESPVIVISQETMPLKFLWKSTTQTFHRKMSMSCLAHFRIFELRAGMKVWDGHDNQRIGLD